MITEEKKPILNIHSPVFMFDVESVGLHGEAFYVAGGIYVSGMSVFDSEFAFSCPIDEAEGDDDDRTWVKNNVFHPPLPTHKIPEEVRQAFWKTYTRHRTNLPNLPMAAECLWPVEARFICACIDDDPELRKWAGPYPFHEIASFMAAAGMDPMATYERKEAELPAHNPLADTRLSARLLYEALRAIKCLDGTEKKGP